MGILGKTMGYIMGYNWQYFQIIGYIKQNLRDKVGKIMGCIWQNIWDIYSKTWDLLVHWIC